MPNSYHPFILEVDTSGFAVGAVLSQKNKQTGQIKPVAYFSKTLSPAQQNYGAAERECLGLILALENWRHILEGYYCQDPTAKKSIIVLTDNIAMPAQLSLQSSLKKARWSQ